MGCIQPCGSSNGKAFPFAREWVAICTISTFPLHFVLYCLGQSPTRMLLQTSSEQNFGAFMVGYTPPYALNFHNILYPDSPTKKKGGGTKGFFFNALKQFIFLNFFLKKKSIYTDGFVLTWCIDSTSGQCEIPRTFLASLSVTA